MALYRNAMIALIAMAPVGLVMAQTTPSQDQTAPSAASSPHQRQATATNAQEAPANNGTEPSSASSPHQQSATDTGSMKSDDKGKHSQMMKDCVAKEQTKDSSVSKDQAKKTCKGQMKSMSDNSMSKQ